MALKLVVVGAGSHSQGNHLPALARYVALHPDEVVLVGLCDLRRQHAEAMAEAYGFARAYADLDEMLRVEEPDACIAVTPIPVTVQIAGHVIRAGLPLLMEKPPGATLVEAQRLVELVAQRSARVMVSMNRRFDPALRAAQHWWGDRPIAYLRACIVRTDRAEPEFAYGTAIHPLDAMRAVAGDVASYRVHVHHVSGVRWYVVHLQFASGTQGVLEVLPTAGLQAESYAWCGEGAYVEASVGEHDAGSARGWRGGTLALRHDTVEGEPLYVQNGTYAETAAFLSALQSDAPMHPSPAEVLQSVEICQAMIEQA
jgi:myo-inositol 2-dehydrogenase / D-chiro-inositol 1-dehydrogenase